MTGSGGLEVIKGVPDDVGDDEDDGEDVGDEDEKDVQYDVRDAEKVRWKPEWSRFL